MIPGCTDVNANNYDPLASIDDSSCCYLNFYDENIKWIGKSVASGIKYLKPESKYLSGIFIGALDKNDLRSAIIQCVKNGAHGVSIFSANGVTDTHLKIIRSFQIN